MAGTYWLTVLPETSKLKAGIRRAVAEVDRGLSVSVTVDGNPAAEGRRFRDRFNREAKAKVRPDVDNSGVGRAGRDGGARYKSGFEEAATLKPEVDTSPAEPQGREYGKEFTRGFSTSTLKLAAAIGGIGLGFKLANGPVKDLLRQTGTISLGLKAAAFAAGIFGSRLVASGSALKAVAGISLGGVGAGLKTVGDQVGRVAKQVTRVTAAIAVGAAIGKMAGFMLKASKVMGLLTIGTAALLGVVSALAYTMGGALVASLTAVGGAMGVAAGAAVGILAPAISVVKMGFAGLSDAAKEFNSTQFKDVDKEFNALVGERMAPLLKSFHELRKSVIDTFSQTLVPAFTNLGGLVDTMRPKFAQLAETMGGLGNRLALSLSSSANTAALQSMFDASNRFFGSFLSGSGLPALTSGLVKFASTAANTFAGVGKGIDGSLTKFGNWLSGITPEKMLAVFETLKQQIENVLNVIRPVFNLIRDLGKVSAPALAPGFKAIGDAIKQATPGLVQMAQILMPALSQVMINLAPLLPGLVQSFMPWSKILAALAPHLATLVTNMAPLAPMILGAVVAFKGFVAAAAVFNTAAGAFNVAKLMAEGWGKLVGKINLAKIGQVAYAGVLRVVAAAQWLLNAAMTANPIGLIIAGVAAVSVALWAFFTKTETGRKMWSAIWGTIKQVAGTVFDFLKDAFATVADKMTWLWQNIAKPVFEGISNAISTFWTAAQVVWELLKAGLQVVGDKLTWLWQNIAVPVFEGVKAAAETMWGGVKVVWDTFTGVLQTVGDKFDAFKKRLADIWDAVKKKVTDTWDSIKDVVGTIGDALGGIANVVTNPAGVVINTLGLGGNANGGAIGYATGGKVWGAGTATSDSIPSMLSNGEHVLTARDVAAMGGQANVYAFRNTLHMAGGGAALAPNSKLPEGGLQGNSILLGRLLGRVFPQLKVIGGYREDKFVDHPSGRALDVMIPDPTSPTGVAIGNAVMGFVMKNADKLGVDYTIWRQTYRSGSGASNVMEDRGSPTQNHMDHVHVTTKPGGPSEYRIPKGLTLPPGFQFGGGDRAVPVGGGGAASVGGSVSPDSTDSSAADVGGSVSSSSSSSSVGGSVGASGGDVTYNDNGDAMVYRVATESELNTSGDKVTTAKRSVRDGEQAITDKTNARDKAGRRLDELRANPKAKAGQITDAENALTKAERELTDATSDLAEKREKAAKAEDDDAELRTNGKQAKAKTERYKGDGTNSGKGGSGSKDGGGGTDLSSMGQTLVSGLFESIGLDGSLFSNFLEWPSVKSLMAGVNFGAGLLANMTMPDAGAGGGLSTAGGFASGAADAVGLGGLLSAITTTVQPSRPDLPASGSPALAPGDFNPAVPGTTLASGTGDMSTFATAGQGSGAAPGPVDNSININGNMGMDPTSVRTQLHSEQNARTRTTKVNG